VLAASIIALMVEAARTTETLVKFYRTVQRYDPEDSRLNTHRHDNLSFTFSTLFSEFLNEDSEEKSADFKSL
jgi:hypothetical protein